MSRTGHRAHPTLSPLCYATSSLARGLPAAASLDEVDSSLARIAGPSGQRLLLLDPDEQRCGPETILMITGDVVKCVRDLETAPDLVCGPGTVDRDRVCELK